MRGYSARFSLFVELLLLMTLLAGCGAKGDLYLPAPKKAPQQSQPAGGTPANP